MQAQVPPLSDAGWAEAAAVAQQWLFEHLLQPVMLAAGLDAQLEAGYVGAWWLLAGLCQLLVLLLVLAPLQRWRPAEAVPERGSVPWRQAQRDIRTDVVYTLVHRLGLFRALMFVTLEPLWSDAIGWLRTLGLPTWHADAWWPGVSDQPLLSFLLYLLIFDFAGWLLHFLQHRWGWWWQLHALHHSQRHMTLWTDNRNHLLDDVIHDAAFVMLGLLIGVAPAQFVAIVAVTQLLESLSHANVRLSFGPVLSRLLVSPKFHRRHHAIEPEAAFNANPAAAVRGCNYGVLFPVWDLLFRTADFERGGPGYGPTGLRDQLPEHGARDYGRGFWQQQWRGLLRLVHRA